MGWLSDNVSFEKFALKDAWDRLRDDPKRMLLGVDPFSTGVWNKALGRDDQPIMNFLGGPMGGDALGIGGGGIYDRAEAEGINTGPAEGMHNIAEVVAAFYGGQGAMNGLGNINMGGGSGLADPAGGANGFSTLDGGAANVDSGGFLSNMFGGGGEQAPWQQFMSGGMPGMGGGQQQQQQPPPTMPHYRPSQGVHVNTQMPGLLADEDERLKYVARLQRGLL